LEEPANRDPLALILYRDPVVSLLSGFALVLIVYLPVAGAMFARWDTRNC
jgi:hypothetical protein